MLCLVSQNHGKHMFPELLLLPSILHILAYAVSLFTCTLQPYLAHNDFLSVARFGAVLSCSDSTARSLGCFSVRNSV